jgi:hypothetical protein
MAQTWLDLESLLQRWRNLRKKLEDTKEKDDELESFIVKLKN